MTYLDDLQAVTPIAAAANGALSGGGEMECKHLQVGLSMSRSMPTVLMVE